MICQDYDYPFLLYTKSHHLRQQPHSLLSLQLLRMTNNMKNNITLLVITNHQQHQYVQDVSVLSFLLLIWGKQIEDHGIAVDVAIMQDFMYVENIRRRSGILFVSQSL